MVDINLDDLVKDFKEEYYGVAKENTIKVISHGDLHFSNILVNEETFEIKFIDVRGAMHQEDLYIDQYYDYAKLFHSIQGFYDLIIHDNFKLNLKEDLSEYFIELLFANKKLITDAYIKIWNEIDKKLSDDEYKIIKVYTKSLFLSMLPLHKENLKHILAFIKISRNIPILK